MNEIYQVVHDPDHPWFKWFCVDKDGFTQWYGNDEAFIRRLARDPAYRWYITEDCIKASHMALETPFWKARLAAGK